MHTEKLSDSKRKINMRNDCGLREPPHGTHITLRIGRECFTGSPQGAPRNCKVTESVTKTMKTMKSPQPHVYTVNRLRKPRFGGEVLVCCIYYESVYRVFGMSRDSDGLFTSILGECNRNNCVFYWIV